MSEATLASQTGTRLKALREDRSLRQEDLAEMARLRGLDWTRATVAGLEIGRRALTFTEMLVISEAFDEPMTTFFEGDGWVALTAKTAVSLEEVRARLRGETPPLDPDRWNTPQLDAAMVAVDDLERFFRFEPYQLLWPEGKLTEATASLLVESAVHETERVVARRFEVKPVAVAMAAVGRWGRGLSAERERRVAEEVTQETPARSLQAIRGHITRDLIDAIAPALRAFAAESKRRLDAEMQAHERIAAASTGSFEVDPPKGERHGPRTEAQRQVAGEVSGSGWTRARQEILSPGRR